MGSSKFRRCRSDAMIAMTAKHNESDCSVEIAKSMFPKFLKLFSKLHPTVPEEGHHPASRRDIQRVRFLYISSNQSFIDLRLNVGPE